jgi:hypothetical protein
MSDSVTTAESIGPAPARKYSPKQRWLPIFLWGKLLPISCSIIKYTGGDLAHHFGIDNVWYVCFAKLLREHADKRFKVGCFATFQLFWGTDREWLSWRCWLYFNHIADMKLIILVLRDFCLPVGYGCDLWLVPPPICNADSLTIAYCWGLYSLNSLNSKVRNSK